MLTEIQILWVPGNEETGVANRGVQRLLNEFVDLLSECEVQQQILGQQ
jgi:hypothetical protein